VSFFAAWKVKLKYMTGLKHAGAPTVRRRLSRMHLEKFFLQAQRIECHVKARGRQKAEKSKS